MSEFGLVAKFQELGIGAILNLQEPGEHAVCGDGLTIPTGFSYDFDDWTNAGSKYLSLAPGLPCEMLICVASQRR